MDSPCLRHGLAALTLSLSLLCPVAFAEDQHDAELERLELTAQPLLHEWLNLPDWVQFSINYTNEINANPLGGERQTGTYTHNVAINSAFSSGFGKEPRIGMSSITGPWRSPHPSVREQACPRRSRTTSPSSRSTATDRPFVSLVCGWSATRARMGCSS